MDEAMPALDVGSDERPREIRLALTLNGGVGLAVWMGGFTDEILELVRAQGVYGRLLKQLDATAVVDVIGGVSAGGLNGAVLAYVLANGLPGINPLKRLWVERGSFQKLLRSPFDQNADSLLCGDDYFLPVIREALEELHRQPTRSPGLQPADHDIDLIMATSLLDGIPMCYADKAGNLIHEVEHRGLFCFKHLRSREPGPGERSQVLSPATSDPREADSIRRRLALAIRSSASFPGAFEASFIPVGDEGDASHPDMEGVLHDADGRRLVRESRYVIDGGALRNKPIGPTLKAIFARPAARNVRRILLYVEPDPSTAGDPHAAAQDDPPTLAEVLLKALVMMPRNETVGVHLEEIERSNLEAYASAELRAGARRLVESRKLETTAQLLVDLYVTSRATSSAHDTLTTVLEHLRATTGNQLVPDLHELLRALAEERRNYLPKQKGDDILAFPSAAITALEAITSGGDVDERGAFSRHATPPVRNRGFMEAPLFPRHLEFLEWAASPAGPLEEWLEVPQLDEIRGAFDGIGEGFATGPSETTGDGGGVQRESPVAAEGNLDRYWPWGISSTQRFATEALAMTRQAMTDLEAQYQHDWGRDTEGRAPHLCSEPSWRQLAGLRQFSHKILRAVGDIRTYDAEFWESRAENLPANPVDFEEWARTTYRLWPDGRPKSGSSERLQLRLAYLALLSVGVLVAVAEHLRLAVPTVFGVGLEESGEEPVEGVWDGTKDLLALYFERGEFRPHVQDWGTAFRRLVAIEIIRGAASPTAPGIEQPVDLIHVTTAHRDAMLGKSHGKVTSIQLGHFGAFYKPSWRANDFMWGRIDGATQLMGALCAGRSLVRVGDKWGDLVERLALVGGTEPPLEVQKEVEAAFGASDSWSAAIRQLYPEVALWLARIRVGEFLRDELRDIADAIGLDRCLGARPSVAAEEFRDEVNRRPTGAVDLLPRCHVGEEKITDDIGTDYLTALGSHAAANLLNTARAGGKQVRLLGQTLGAIRGAFLGLWMMARGAIAGSRGLAVPAFMIALYALAGLGVGWSVTENPPTWVPPIAWGLMAVAITFAVVRSLDAARPSWSTLITILLTATVALLAGSISWLGRQLWPGTTAPLDLSSGAQVVFPGTPPGWWSALEAQKGAIVAAVLVVGMIVLGGVTVRPARTGRSRCDSEGGHRDTPSRGVEEAKPQRQTPSGEAGEAGQTQAQAKRATGFWVLVGRMVLGLWCASKEVWRCPRSRLAYRVRLVFTVVLAGLVGAWILSQFGSDHPWETLRFEFAFTQARAEAFVAEWTRRGVLGAVRAQVGWDYLFVLFYAATLALLARWAYEVVHPDTKRAEAVRRQPSIQAWRTRKARATRRAMWAVAIAAVADFIENGLLLIVLHDPSASVSALVAGTMATLKFAAITYVLWEVVSVAVRVPLLEEGVRRSRTDRS